MTNPDRVHKMVLKTVGKAVKLGMLASEYGADKEDYMDDAVKISDDLVEEISKYIDEEE